MKIKIKKSKNPFLYAGSYIGLIVGLIGAYFSFAVVLSLAETDSFKTVALLIPLLPIFFGFLFGWAIHLMIAK